MTCPGCGAHETMQRTRYCARCLLIAVAVDADAAISTEADEAPPCELLSIMGDSSRATTFLGEQTWPVRRLVALKVFKDKDHSAPRPVHHPGIAPVLETGRLGGRRYVMAPYFAGGALPKCYDRHRLGAGARTRALATIADALAVAHAQGLAHGRLTASNLLCEPAAPFAVHIVDFDGASSAGSDNDGWEVLVRADLAALVGLAEALLRSPIAPVPASVDVTTELSRISCARRLTDMRRALEGLAARLAPR